MAAFASSGAVFQPGLRSSSFTACQTSALQFPLHSANAVTMTSSPGPSVMTKISRRAVFQGAMAFAGAALIAGPGSPLSVLADTESIRMSGNYKADAAAMLESMKSVCELGRGAPGMVDTVNRTRKQMNEFVAFYRRNNKVSGSVSFSTMYTAINTLSGHYMSYGSAYPVPEKRRKRLNIQFKEISRALDRGR